MSEAAAAADRHPGSQQFLGVTTGKLAMWVFLGSDGMSFMGLIAAYVALRIGNAESWPVPSVALDIPLTAVNTFILICSSVSMVKAFVSAQEGNVKGLKLWLLVTIVGGCIFLGIQAYEYTHLIHNNMTPVSVSDTVARYMAEQGRPEASPLFGATFYALTCFHGFHVLSGVIYLSVILGLVMAGSWTVNRIEIVGLYWHFVDLVWIVIFTIVYLVE